MLHYDEITVSRSAHIRSTTDSGGFAGSAVSQPLFRLSASHRAEAWIGSQRIIPFGRRAEVACVQAVDFRSAAIPLR